MVDARIESKLIQDDDTGLFCFGIKCLHLRFYIRSSHHIFLQPDAFLCNHHMIKIRQKADRQIVISDHPVEFGFLVYFSTRRDGNDKIFIQQITYDGFYHHTGSKDEDFFHDIYFFKYS